MCHHATTGNKRVACCMPTALFAVAEIVRHAHRDSKFVAKIYKDISSLCVVQLSAVLRQAPDRWCPEQLQAHGRPIAPSLKASAASVQQAAFILCFRCVILACQRTLFYMFQEHSRYAWETVAGKQRMFRDISGHTGSA